MTHKHGTARPHDSGRYDSLGRPIKIASARQNPNRNLLITTNTPPRDIHVDTTETIIDLDAWEQDHDTVITSAEDIAAQFTLDTASAMSTVDEYVENGNSHSQLLLLGTQLATDDTYRNIIGTLDHYNAKRANKIRLTPEESANEKALKALSADYRAVIAKSVHHGYEAFSDDMVTEYTGDRIGSQYRGGEYRSGTADWLTFRWNGIGGSDMGPIATGSGINKLWKDKTTTPAYDASRDTFEVDYHHPAGRGSALEEFIGGLYAKNNPQENVLHTKATWVNDEDPTQINYDFLLSSNGIDPDGTLEIKTANNPSLWGDPRDGLDGVPAAYRAQVLSQALQGGFTRGAVAVLFNESRYQEYHFTMTEDLLREAHVNRERAVTFWNSVLQARIDPTVKNPLL